MPSPLATAMTPALRLSTLLALAGGRNGRECGGAGSVAAFVHPPRRRPNPDGRRRGGVVAGYSNRDEGAAARESKSDDDVGGEVRAGLPRWVKSLTRWDPPRDSSVSAPVDAEADAEKDRTSFDSFSFFGAGGESRRFSAWEAEMSPDVASMSGMVNLEALLAAADETDDALSPGMDYLKKTTDADEWSGMWKKDAKAPSQNKFPELRWDELVPLLQKNVQVLTDLIPDGDLRLNVTVEDLVNMVPDEALLPGAALEEMERDSRPSASASPEGTEKVLQDAAQRLESLINGTSLAFSRPALRSLLLRASDALAVREAAGKDLTAAAYEMFERAGKAPLGAAAHTAALVQFANEVLVEGYAPLFAAHPSVRSVPAEERREKVAKAAEFAALAGAIYEDAVPGTRGVGHAIVARGKTANIGWMVTDSLQYEREFRSGSRKEEPVLVRTFVLRGYDASDEEVDREGLLNVICTATPVPIRNDGKKLVQVHEGMLSMARDLMRELEVYMDTTAPSHKFAFTGHSIGGSLAVLLMILMANERGASFVRNKVLRVFTFGSPPIFEMKSFSNLEQVSLEVDESSSILEAFDLPNDIVRGYNQPWDPIVRLYSKYDPLYPLIDDLGEDGYTPWVNGPQRTLRPILKTILQSWEGWPQYRDNARVKLGQNYRSTGEQFLLLPEPIRYLTDRLVSVDTSVPEISEIVQVSAADLLPALNDVFTLDTFAISYVSVAIRSFIHHFYPAYGSPFIDIAKKLIEDEEDLFVT